MAKTLLTRIRSRLRYEAHRAPALLLGRIRSNAVKYYYWRDHPNFGDQLTAPLLRHFGLTAVYTRAERAELVCVGSVLEAVPENFEGWILGAGLLLGGPRNFHKARVWAVRGELTRKMIRADQNTVLGDPGLLCDRLVTHPRVKRFKIGLVPHYMDRADPRLHLLALKHRPALRIIDVRGRPIQVISAINECERILSSSLHGLVAADALGISNGWICLSHLIGGRFKFDDYASGIGRRLEPQTVAGQESLQELALLAKPVVEGVARAKADLTGCFERFSSMVRRQNQDPNNDGFFGFPP